MTICSLPVDATPAEKDPTVNESSPLLSSVRDRNYTEEVLLSNECEKDVEVSDTHKAKDFQLIHVPKGAVSFMTDLHLKYYTMSCNAHLRAVCFVNVLINIWLPMLNKSITVKGAYYYSMMQCEGVLV